MTLSAQCRKWLAAQFGSAVLFDEPMSRHTYFNIGGPADALVKPESLEKLIELIHGCRDFNIDWWVMGKGSNLLVADRGIRGVTIVLDACLNKIEKKEATEKEVRINAMAGAPLAMLCRYALANAMGGLNFALGIPGSVGGGIMMNAGTALGSMKDVVLAVTALLPSGKIVRIAKQDIAFSYRSLVFTHPLVLEENGTAVILEGCFSLHPEDPETLKAQAETIMNNRCDTQPVDERSSGCFFKNPEFGQPAGRLIEDAGLKGMTVGDAQVSTRHANFIINRGRATADDVARLMENIQSVVNKKFNIFLEPEVKIVGEQTS